MDHDSLRQHLSAMSTAWTVLHEANADGLGSVNTSRAAARSRAQALMLERYGSPIYRYLLAALRDRDAADEAFQEFALRFIRGDFRRADQRRGRFRDFLKTALFHLVVDARRRRRRDLPRLADGPEAPGPHNEAEARPEPDLLEADRRFLEAWRDDLLARAWEALAEHERRTSQPVHRVLRLRTDHPEMRSPAMAERLAVDLGRPVSHQWVRKKLLLAREVFTDALLAAVAASLANPTREDLERELIDLGLLGHCRDALARRDTA